MSRRGLYFGAILLVWGTTLGWQVKRLYFRPVSELLADAARTIPPGTAYYAVFREDRQVGWAQTDVDTLPGASGFLLRNRLILSEPLLPGLEPLNFQIEATVGPTFILEHFQVSAEGVPGIRHVRGDVHGDTILELGLRGDGPSRSQQIRLEEPILVAAAWPLRFAAEREVRPGDEFQLPVYDPLTGSHRTMHLRVLAEEIRTFPDSVTAENGTWVIAREDTVRAWHVQHDLSGITLSTWVDEDGRLLEASAPGGIRLERTAFEIAYFGQDVPERLRRLEASAEAPPVPDGGADPEAASTPTRSDDPSAAGDR